MQTAPLVVRLSPIPLALQPPLHLLRRLQPPPPKALNMTIEDLSTVKNQLKAFVASKKRREVEASLAEMTDDDYMSSFNAMMKGD